MGPCKEKCVGSGKMWGGVWESVWGEWRSVLACGERIGRDVGKCVRVWGSNTLPDTLSHISSLPSSFHTSPPHPNTRSCTSSHTSSHIFFPPSTPLHIFLLSSHLPSPFQSVAKLLCDEVTEAKLPCGEVTGNLAK